MKEPTPLVYIFGSKAGFLATAGGAGLVICLWLNGQASGMSAFIAAMVMAGACKAYREVQAFRAWQRNWNALAGTPAPRQGKHWASAIWMLLLALVIAQPVDDPTFRSLTEWAFLLMSLVLATRFVWRLARRIRARPASAAEPRHVVEVCLPVVRRAATVREATAALPDYCKQLLRHGSKE